MGDKLKKARQRRTARRTAARQAQPAQPQGKPTSTPKREPAAPTAERKRRGCWHAGSAWVDLASDMPGALHVAEVITLAQLEAARHFQIVRADYLHELPDLKSFKSCLHDEVPGFDDGEGDPQVIEAYRRVERAAGWRGVRELLRVCEDNQKPRSIETLRAALNAVGGSVG